MVVWQPRCYCFYIALSTLVTLCSGLAGFNCPVFAAHECHVEHPFLPDMQERRRTRLPLGCPIKSFFLADAGWGNRVGQLVTLASFGVVLNRPIVVRWEDYRYRTLSGDTPHHGKLFDEDVFNVAISQMLNFNVHHSNKWRVFASLVFVSRSVYNSINNTEDFHAPPLDLWPSPKAYIDLVPETAYIWLMKLQAFMRFSSYNAKVRCISFKKWLDVVAATARNVRPSILHGSVTLTTGLPRTKNYIALYIRFECAHGGVGDTNHLAAVWHLRVARHHCIRGGCSGGVIPWMVRTFHHSSKSCWPQHNLCVIHQCEQV